MFKRFKQDIAAIGYLSIGLFIGLSLLSFNPRDPSLNSIGQGLMTTNYCGIVGSFLSDIFYQLFGLASWVIVLSLVRLSFLAFKGGQASFRNIRVLWGALLIFTVSSLASLYFPGTQYFSNQILVGGLIGLGISKALLSAFNYIGVQIILWSCVGVLVVFYSEKTIQELFKLPLNLLSKVTLAMSEVKSMVISKLSERSAKAKKVNVVDYKVAKTKQANLFTTNNMQETVFNISSDGEESVNETKTNNNYVDNSEENLDSAASQVFSSSLSNRIPDQLIFDEDLNSLPKRKVIMKTKVPKRVENWEMPKISLLEDPPASRIKLDKAEIQKKAELLTGKLQNFNVEGEISDAKPGPLVTMYEFKPNADVKISKISELEDDLSLALSSESVRVVGHIPGRDVVGIETANTKRETVYYKDLIAEDRFWSDDLTLPMALGRQVDGVPKIVDLRKMPHLLVGGTTGSGKSVFVGSIITGLLFRHSPKTLRIILIDPKMVDLAVFSKVPHLILPHLTESKKAVTALRWAVREMEKRYRSLSKFGASKIEVFNEKIARLTKEEIEEHERINAEYEASGRAKSEQYYYTNLPFIVIVVDELADLMVVEKQNIETPIQRLTQMARACGMHLILATQSPRKDVVTGLIKTNIPGRIALKVASKMDSRIILDEGGAERLLPNGDMLFLSPGVNRPTRHHGPYLSDKEISNVVNYWGDQGEPQYDEDGMAALNNQNDGSDMGASGGISEEEYDDRYDEILAWASQQKEISASLIQRKFRLGYPRAARIIELFEREGIVGPPSGSKARQVLVNNFKEL